MANNPHFSLAVRDSALDQISASLGGSAYLIMYAGLQPADASAALTAANVSVARLAMTTSSAFAPATAGAATANAITDDSSAAGGSANWFSLEPTAADGTARVLDGEVGTSGADLNLNSQAIATGATVSVTDFQVSIAQ